MVANMTEIHAEISENKILNDSPFLIEWVIESDSLSLLVVYISESH